MLVSFAITSINHVLRCEGWGCKRLQYFSGKVFCIRIPPLVHFKLLIDTDGQLQLSDQTVCADVIMTISPFLLPMFLTSELTAFKQIKIAGDQTLADELITICQHMNLGLILENDLSRAIGDIPAHRVSQAGAQIRKWQTDNFERVFQTLIEYWTEENLTVAKSAAIRSFCREVTSLEQNTDQLEQRLGRLIQKGA